MAKKRVKETQNNSKILRGLEEVLSSLKHRFNEGFSPKKTAYRIIRVWMEMSESCNKKPPQLKWFKTTAKNYLIKGPINVYFLCPHHLLPVDAKVFIGLIPNGYTLGISKITRMVHWAVRKIDLQENITKQIADHLWDDTRLKGLIVIIIGDHYCEKIRGIRSKSPAISIEFRGKIENNLLLAFKDILGINLSQ